ncbi:MAG TPA: hypothetical protein VNZ45_02570 [Bacteroidia bacterium]|jgi:hypothetical protein|nr:hypothetical protein [Bacteroidia bacterium]
MKKTFEYEPMNVLDSKINAIKLIRDFTKEAFGSGASLISCKDMVVAMIEYELTEQERIKVRNNVLNILKLVPTDKRWNLFEIIADSMVGQPHFNRFDNAYTAMCNGIDDIKF